MLNVDLYKQTKKPVILKSILKNFVLLISASYCLMANVTSAKNTAYITNQGDNTVSVIDIDLISGQVLSFVNVDNNGLPITEGSNGNFNFNDTNLNEYIVNAVLSPPVKLEDVTGISVGDAVTSLSSSTFIPQGTSVVAVDTDENLIYINNNYNYIYNQVISIGGNTYTVVNGTNIINLITVKDVQVGQQVTGANLPNSVKVLEVIDQSNEVVVSRPVSVSSGQPLFFAFDSNISDAAVPFKTRWFSNLYVNKLQNRVSSNPNAEKNSKLN